ncbi:FG-GAP repeat domain-containing protein [Streptomyces sp. NPDC090126]|uniref:FG-GAP repeat domain-containing protein n=1 Tax=Streptomyces sp. NPDC090126 TaxID=3365952 RepID=UPI00382CD8C8
MRPRTRTRTEHPQAAVTRRVTASLTAGGTALLLALTACTGPSSASDGKNGDTPPPAQARPQAQTVSTPVPRGTGSRVPYDFNGDGHRDLVIDDLVKAPGNSHGDDAGIGIVYGTADPGRPLDPATRQLLSARANAAKSGDTLPAAFDAEAACDLDRDGFTDLIVSTDPPYNGIGAPPVPLQILFGSPQGLTGKAVTVRIPQQARSGNEWPEQPVCGDFDGDGYDDLVAATLPHAPGQAGRGTLLLGSPEGPARPGGTYAFAAEDVPTAPLRTAGATRTTLLNHGDYDGDRKPDTVVRTYRGELRDLIALYRAGTTDEPLVTFSTALFLP